MILNGALSADSGHLHGRCYDTWAMISASSSGRYPQRLASATSSRAFSTTALRPGPTPLPVPPRPRRNSTSPSSRNVRRPRNTVLALTPSTAARSRAGGSRSPAAASPLAIARRIAAATCSCSGTGLPWSISMIGLVLLTLASYYDFTAWRTRDVVHACGTGRTAIWWPPAGPRSKCDHDPPIRSADGAEHLLPIADPPLGPH